jgi:phenylalanyl-tRNA synthetase alpha chain
LRHDLSIAVSSGTSAEELGDRVRTALGSAAEAIESVEVLTTTRAESMPAPAAARIGIRPGQINLLVRLVLRHPTRTLTAAKGNRLRDQMYAALHEGTMDQWASGGPPT